MNISVKKYKNGKILVAGGLAQSVYPPLKTEGYWRHMVPDGLGEKEELEVLMLGVGAGTIARLILEKYPKAKITGVDNSPEIIKIARKNLKLDKIKMKLIIGDAFKFIEDIRLTEKYDLIIVDLFAGHWFPLGIFLEPFITSCQRLLVAGGQLLINTINTEWLASIYLPNVEMEIMAENTLYKWSKT